MDETEIQFSKLSVCWVELYQFIRTNFLYSPIYKLLETNYACSECSSETTCKECTIPRNARIGIDRLFVQTTYILEYPSKMQNCKRGTNVVDRRHVSKQKCRGMILKTFKYICHALLCSLLLLYYFMQRVVPCKKSEILIRWNVSKTNQTLFCNNSELRTSVFLYLVMFIRRLEENTL